MDGRNKHSNAMTAKCVTMSVSTAAVLNGWVWMLDALHNEVECSALYKTAWQ